MRARPARISDSIVSRPTTFDVGEHKLLLTKLQERRWTVDLDGRLLAGSYDTQADAWEAGVREAHRVDQVGGG